MLAIPYSNIQYSIQQCHTQYDDDRKVIFSQICDGSAVTDRRKTNLSRVPVNQLKTFFIMGDRGRVRVEASCGIIINKPILISCYFSNEINIK